MGVFDEKAGDLFARYQATLQFRDRLVGGVPKRADVMYGWIRTKAGVEDVEEIRQMMLRTLGELGVEVPEGATFEEMEKASVSVAQKSGVGFKRDDQGLYIEDRQVKAAIKEATNVLFAGDRWGPTKKGPKSFVAERVFVNPSHIYLDRREPDGVEMFVGHVNGPRGPQSNLTLYEYVERPVVTIELKVLRDSVEAQNWPQLWVFMQENGIGALRSQSYGRFDVVDWKKL